MPTTTAVAEHVPPDRHVLQVVDDALTEDVDQNVRHQDCDEQVDVWVSVPSQPDTSWVSDRLRKVAQP